MKLRNYQSARVDAMGKGLGTRRRRGQARNMSPAAIPMVVESQNEG
jgi:hypothetical protein